MRVLFLTPSHNVTIGLNQGVAILSALLKREGHEVQYILIHDRMGHKWSEWQQWLPKKLDEFKPHVIGHSVMTPQYKYTRILGEYIDHHYPHLVQVVGGPHPSQYPNEVFTEGSKFIDLICLGEADYAFPQFLRINTPESMVNRTYRTDIKNLWFKFDDGKVIQNPNDTFVDLTKLPPEDKTVFDLDKYILEKGNQIEVTVGRGCPYKCTYCFNESYFDLYKKDNPILKIKDFLRFKDMDVIFKEIQDALALSKTPIRALSFVDDNFLINKDFLEKFCSRYKKEIGLPFVVNVHPLTLNEVKGEIIGDAGVISMRFGVESGSERLRKDILDRQTPEASIHRAFNIARKFKVMPSSYNMIGIPTETQDEVLETLKLNGRLSPDVVKIMTFYPFHGTRLYDFCVKHNLIDWVKKEKLDNYDSGTCLTFSKEHQFFLEKVQTIFPWYLNLFGELDVLEIYQPKVEEALRMTEEEWKSFDYEGTSKTLNQAMEEKNLTHYRTHFNRSIAVKFPTFWERSSLQRQHEIADPGEQMK
ncbi:MAG: B12-binding domain-containing radical SAM protein [Deltaproteobacteria bacterium]|nr:B12-binding domain-containing radical SAM protein [Deltaproteobacteria bacterium]